MQRDTGRNYFEYWVSRRSIDEAYIIRSWLKLEIDNYRESKTHVVYKIRPLVVSLSLLSQLKSTNLNPLE